MLILLMLNACQMYTHTHTETHMHTVQSYIHSISYDLTHLRPLFWLYKLCQYSYDFSYNKTAF